MCMSVYECVWCVYECVWCVYECVWCVYECVCGVCMSVCGVCMSVCVRMCANLCDWKTNMPGQQPLSAATVGLKCT